MPSFDNLRSLVMDTPLHSRVNVPDPFLTSLFSPAYSVVTSSWDTDDSHLAIAAVAYMSILWLS